MRKEVSRFVALIISLLAGYALLVSCYPMNHTLLSPSLEGKTSDSGSRLVAILTDYGTEDFYVGALQGAMYTVNPQVRIATITHQIEPFNVAEGSFVLAQAAQEFPPGTVFLAVVDPGVGTRRRSIVMESLDGKLFVAPDNGLLTGVMDELGIVRAFKITNPGVMRQVRASTTFHGRDIYGPVAARLARGMDPADVGPEIVDLVRLPIKKPRREGSVITGYVVHIDRYGNLITNIPGDMIREKNFETGKLIHITINDKLVTANFAKTYGDVPEGAWLALVNAQNLLEIARNLRNASKTLKASTGMRVRLE